jgi:hypothetical protein
MVAGDKTRMASFSGIPQPFQKFRQRGERESREGGMRSFVNGIVSPFTACWQPSLSSCAPACGTRDYTMPPRQPPSPSIVTPLVDRFGQPAVAPTSPRSEASYGYESGGASPSPKPNPPEPATDIEKSHSNDVLCGRGGSSNRHLGNMHFRELVAANKKTYVSLTKKQKMLVARKIVDTVHNTEPPGRFLAKDLDSGLWYDIGLPRSLEKTSQALREKNSNDFPVGHDDASETGSGFDAPINCGSSLTCGGEGEKRKTSRRSKNVEAPPLIIPPHLKRFYCPTHPLSPYHEQSVWSDHGPSSGIQLDQPYLHQPSLASPSSANDQYYVPPRTPNFQYNEAAPRSPPHHYHYDNRVPYGQGHSREYDHPSADHHHEHYDYYRRQPDYRDRYPPHPPPHVRGPHSSRGPPPPPPGHYSHYPPPRPTSHYHGRSPAHPPTPPSRARDPYGYGHAPPAPISSPSQPPMYRTASNSYIRGRSEVSPERRQEWKRQRNETGHARRLSDSSLSGVMENSLSIQDRRAEQPPSIRRTLELTSPSSILQSRSRRSVERPPKAKSTTSSSSGTDEATDVSRLSGLAALSTAAFLKLDEA